jgi:hypothetical protein
MTDSQQDTLDFTMMYVTHDALRRAPSRTTTSGHGYIRQSPTSRPS